MSRAPDETLRTSKRERRRPRAETRSVQARGLRRTEEEGAVTQPRDPERRNGGVAHALIDCSRAGQWRGRGRYDRRSSRERPKRFRQTRRIAFAISKLPIHKLRGREDPFATQTRRAIHP